MNIRSTPISTCDPVLPVPTRRDAAPISLGFLSVHNPHDRTAFSGTAHFAAKALGAFPGVNLRILGPHRPPRLSDRVLRRTPSTPEAATLNLDGLDAIVSLVSTPLLNDLAKRTRLPLLHVTDATPSFLRTAYGWDIPHAADAAEAEAIANAAAVIYSSGFMAGQAQRDFGAGFAPCVAPFGVNFNETPLLCPEKPALERLELLFVCSDWARKGGETALAALEALRKAGQPAHLTVVGRMPDALKTHPDITFVGFLNKNRTRAAARLARLYARAHLLLLPSAADCTPMVLAEAMAHGTPVLATETGGVTEAIENARKVVGRTLPVSAEAIIWASEIRAMTADPAVYRAMSMAAFEHCNVQLSWQAWSAKIVTIARNALFEATARAA
ncbi:MAG: glycosyltransferase family 4 protein [Pseudomonadota bacterium]